MLSLATRWLIYCNLMNNFLRNGSWVIDKVIVIAQLTMNSWLINGHKIYQLTISRVISFSC